MVYAQQLQIPEHFVPVLFDIGHLVEGDVEGLTNSVGVLAVFLWGARPTLIQGVPVLHKNSRYTITFTGRRQK